MGRNAVEEIKEKKVTLLHKVGYLFFCLQKKQILGLAVLILIGGLLETMGVSLLLPVVQAIMDPEAIMENELVGAVADLLQIETSRQLIILMLGSLIALYVINAETVSSKIVFSFQNLVGFVALVVNFPQFCL